MNSAISAIESTGSVSVATISRVSVSAAAHKVDDFKHVAVTQFDFGVVRPGHYRAVLLYGDGAVGQA